MRVATIAGLCALLSACYKSPEEKLIKQDYRQGNETYVLGKLPEYGLTGRCEDLVEYQIDGREGIVVIKENLQHKLRFSVVNQWEGIPTNIPITAFGERTAEEVFAYAKRSCLEISRQYGSLENWHKENLKDEQDKKFKNEKTEIDRLLNSVLKGEGKKKERIWSNNPYF